MKNRNHENSNKWFVALWVLILVTLPACHRVNSEQRVDNILVFEGTLEKLGPEPVATSGRMAVYRLAKYRVERVCKGKYEGGEIVVDHLIFDLKDFEGLEVNDRV